MSTRFEKLKEELARRNAERGMSELEKWVLRFFPEYKIYDYTLEYQIGMYFVDIAWPQLKYGVELDGLTFHATPEQVDRDVKKDIYLQKLGWEIKRIDSYDCWRPNLLKPHLIEISGKINGNNKLFYYDFINILTGVMDWKGGEKTEKENMACNKCGEIIELGRGSCRCGKWNWGGKLRGLDY